MHCKHCGNQIENDSKFCSFCGGKIEPIGQSIPIQQPISNEPLNNPVTERPRNNSQNHANSDKGLLVAFAVMVGLRLFWFVSDLLNKDKSYSDLETYINFVIKPTYVVFWSVPLILALFSKRKEQRIILLVISLVIIGWTIYENFIKSV
ncbi:zinc ribbon domain-containing protein [Flavobacterium filum]|uniref:zinc ribbon domain-containing protein n=1 Tax=Flavobacterium filum TaxID=370974 RepID=UPI0023F112F2|nr:zinc ribbon domain-containing protein [Flavobacterium filum]